MGSKDLNEQVTEARKFWPRGAVSIREAIRAEVSALGVTDIETKYWKTCTVRLLWVYRAMRIFDIVLEDFVRGEKTPVESAQHSVNTVLAQHLNSVMKRLADFIIFLCVHKKRA